MKSINAALVVIGTTGALLMTSCDKQKSMSELSSTVQKAEEQSAKQAATLSKTAARGEEVTSEEDYAKVFMALAATLDEQTTMQITTAEGGYVFTLLTQHPAPDS